MQSTFTYTFAVRYLEVDQQGVVFNMWYLAYFDEAMTAFLASAGASYDALRAEGYDAQLVRSEIDWSDGLRWGDQPAVDVRCARIGATSFTLEFVVRRGDEVVVRGSTVYVVVAADGSGKRPVPDVLRRALTA